MIHMQIFFITFTTSLVLTYAIIFFNNYHLHLTGDCEFAGIHKNHTLLVPRIGGVSIFLALCVGAGVCVYKDASNRGFYIYLLASFPFFILGLVEDLTKRLSIKTRFILIVIFSFATVTYFNAHITKVDVAPLDYLLTYPLFSIALTVFSIAGLVNAYNIIDGFHGLSSMIGIMALGSLGILAHLYGDEKILSICIYGVAAILGFVFFNYPKGLIFLGDGGAYLIGFTVGILTIFLISKNSEISPWVAILINIYPITETIFTIYRRKFKKNKNPGIADRLHLHSLLFRRSSTKSGMEISITKRNSTTSIYVWLFSLNGIVPAILFANSTRILVFFTLLNILFYIRVYTSIVNFRTPNYLKYLQSILQSKLKA